MTVNQRIPRLTAVVTLAAVMVPRSAGAHPITTGLGPFYDGISHAIVSPDDLVPMIAIAMLAGLAGRVAARSALFGLTGGWFLGGMLGLFATVPRIPQATTIVSFMVLGSLTAMDRRVPLRLLVGLAVAVGFLHGWLNGVGLAEVQGAAIGLAGTAIAAFVVVAIVSAQVVRLQAPWTRIAVRVAGSWVAAIGLLMLGWTLRGTR
jgi:hydrogenase/urease accessory protein HupE